jgi:type VI secretion system protein ImpC
VPELLTRLDVRLSNLLDSILLHPSVRALESAWRGLRYLVVESETGAELVIKLLDISKRELYRDLTRAPAHDQSFVYKRVYEDSFGGLAGEPFGVLVGVYQFSQHPEDLRLLGGMAGIAASAHAPFVGAAAAQMFGFDDYEQIARVRDIGKIFMTPEYAPWNAFRDTEDARWVALTLPEILLRPPYHYQTEAPCPFAFAEGGAGAGTLLWGNAAFALAACMTRAFAEENWVSNIQGVEGGRVANLPLARIVAEDGTAAKVCTSLRISDRLELGLHDSGFSALVQSRDGDEAIFFAVSSCQRPRVYDSTEATGNARILTQLPTVMVCARFAQYLQVVTRYWIGSFKERADYEALLNRWLSEYVSHEPVDSDQLRARYPLREGSVSVAEMPGSPGAYQAMLYLRPQYGMEGLSVSVRVPVVLPSKA